MDASYWQEQAERFRQRAEGTGDRTLAQELIELAEVCDQVAADLDDRALAG